MKADKLSVDEIEKDQILIGDDIAKELIKKHKTEEIAGTVIGLGTIVLLYGAYKGSAGLIAMIIIAVLGFGWSHNLNKSAAKWEDKLQIYYMNKKTTNPDFQYVEKAEE